MKTASRAGVLAMIALATSLGTVSSAQAATTIDTAEIKGSWVRITGSEATPNSRVLVNGGWLSGRTDASGGFTIQASTFTVPASCKVTVTDGVTSATAVLSGCTVTPTSHRRAH